MNLGLALYRAVATAAFPFLKGRLAKSHAVGFDERCGVYSREKIDQINLIRGAGIGENFWLHAVSVGEVQAAGPLVRAARDSGYGGAITMSTVTVTGAGVASKLIGDGVTAHVYAPWDIPGVVARVCDALRPAAYATVETEVWPNLLYELKCRGIPRFLVNARVSDRTWAKSGRLTSIYRSAYGLFDLVMARGGEDARRLAAFGVQPEKIIVTGDCKIDAILQRREEVAGELPGIRAKLGIKDGDILFVAGSTHEGEDEIVLDAFGKLKSDGDSECIRLVIVPRHPERAGDVLRTSQKHGSAILYSELEEEKEEKFSRSFDIIVVDVIGVLYGLYGVASSAFIGGSLVPKGGQNILEPASWGVPVLHGPHMEDFAEPTAQLDKSGDAYQVKNSDDIAEYWKKVSSDPQKHIEKNPPPYFACNVGAAAKTWKLMQDIIQVSPRE